MMPDSPPGSVARTTSAPARAHILCLAGGANLAIAAAKILRVRFHGSHIIELLQEPDDVAAVIKALHRGARGPSDEVEVIVADEPIAASTEAALLRAHWPAARWALLGERDDATRQRSSRLHLEFSPAGAEALMAKIQAAVDAYRHERWAELSAALARMELFRGLPSERFGWLAERVELRRYTAGEVIVNAGEPGDGVYFIRAGAVNILDAEPLGGDRVIARRGRGEHFGELSLITGELRSNTVAAELESEIFFLPKAHYDELMDAEPRMGVHLTRVLSTRLARAHRQHRPPPRIIACCRVLHDPEGATTRALATALAAETERSVVVLELQAAASSTAGDHLQRVIRGLERSPAPSRDDCVELGPGLYGLAVHGPETLRDLSPPGVIPALLEGLTRIFPFVVVGLGAQIAADLFVRVAKQCDVLLVHVGPGTAPLRAAGGLLAMVRRDCPSVESKILIAGSPPLDPEIGEDLGAALGRPVDHLLPAAPSGGSALRASRRWARRLVGIAVGLSLGGGGARGAAHMGVLEVLEQEGIMVDLISGTSVGAIVGAGHAMGRSVAEAIELWRRETRVNPIRQYTLSKTALFSGRGLEAMVRRLYGDLYIEALPIPFFAVATDLRRGAAVPIDRGPLWLAVRASCSLPGAVPPVRIGDTYFVDGGVSNNVPADIVRARGARFVIAVDVSRYRGFRTREDARGRGGRLVEALRRLRRVRDFLDAPSMVHVVMRAMEVQAAQTVSARAWSWNTCIRPDVADFASLEFGATDLLIARGREAAAASLPEIRAGLRSLLEGL